MYSNAIKQKKSSLKEGLMNPKSVWKIEIRNVVSK